MLPNPPIDTDPHQSLDSWDSPDPVKIMPCWVHVLEISWILLMGSLIAVFWRKECDVVGMSLIVHCASHVFLILLAELIYFLFPYIEGPGRHKICTCARAWGVLGLTTSAVFYIISFINLHQVVFSSTYRFNSSDQVCQSGNVWKVARGIVILTYCLFSLIPLGLFWSGIVHPTVQCCQEIYTTRAKSRSSSSRLTTSPTDVECA